MVNDVLDFGPKTGAVLRRIAADALNPAQREVALGGDFTAFRDPSFVIAKARWVLNVARGSGYGWDMIADRYGISRERARQIGVWLGVHSPDDVRAFLEGAGDTHLPGENNV